MAAFLRTGTIALHQGDSLRNIIAQASERFFGKNRPLRQLSLSPASGADPKTQDTDDRCTSIWSYYKYNGDKSQ